MKAFIVYATYSVIDEKTVVQLIGKLENGQSFVSLSELKPYFFIREKDLKSIERYLSKYRTEKTDFVNFQREKVVKISAENHRELNKLHHAIHSKLDTYEADIKPPQRFLMDNHILNAIEIEGDYETADKIDRVYRNPRIKPSESRPDLKVISLDIETDKNIQKLICIGLYGQDYKKVFFVTDKKLDNAISCKTEEECLKKFRDEIIKIDPDIITGWNIVDFDLLHLQRFFARHKIPFDIGRTNDNVKLRIESNFLRASSADIPGRQVLDGLNLIADPFLQQAPSMRNAQFESYSLDNVAKVILGAGIGKTIKKRDDIERLYNEDTQKNHQKIADYNINDCKLVFDILEKTKTLELAIARSQLTGMTLDRLMASIAAFDSLYIREARKRGIVSPTTRYSTKEERIRGVYVHSAKSGIFNNVLVLDFKSLYPSIICTFNIDPASRLEKKEKDAIETPNHIFFRNEDGILPHMIKYLHRAREQAKKEKKEFASYAIKTIMNSFWGVLGSPSCRYFNLDTGNAIIALARWIIQTTAKRIEEMGYKAIYSDTDSVFVETNLDKHKADKLGAEIQKDINDFFKRHIKERFNRTSYLELEFDKQFISMMIPQLRAKKGEEKTEKPAKKKYAGLVERDGKEELEVTGLEAIRGDWTEAARDFQKELLMKVFKHEEIEPFIKSYIKKIKQGKMDSKLVYRKSIRKALDHYTKTTPPHVKAARKLDSLDSNVIEYYITEEGPEPIQKLIHKIDYEHYIIKQIAPIANQVLVLLNKSLEEIEKNSKQAKLF